MSYIDIGQGIKTLLRKVPAIKQVFAPDELPVSVNDFPTALIVPGDMRFQETFSADLENAFDADFRILILMTKAVQEVGLSTVIPLLDNGATVTSLRQAIYVDRTLGGAVSEVILTSSIGVSWVLWGGEQYLSQEFKLTAFS